MFLIGIYLITEPPLSLSQTNYCLTESLRVEIVFLTIIIQGACGIQVILSYNI